MKVLKISAIVFLSGALLFSASCKKTFYTEANVNPNAPGSVTPSSLLSTVEGSIAYVQNGDLSRFASMFVQQTKGISRQAQAYDEYIFTGQDVDNTWGNIYTSIFMNNDSLLAISDAHNYHYYSGIARILKAYSLQMTVDFWGKIPYSQALHGRDVLQPAYDDDQTLYNTVQSLCDSAIALLASSEPGDLAPGSEDFVYGGDAGEWTKFAHALKARNYLHQSKGNAAMASNALAQIALSFTSNNDNATYKFTTAATDNNPWYQFNTQRADIGFVESSMANNMLLANDPRYPFLFDTTMNNPIIPGDNLGAYYGAPDASVEFITYDEVLFMQAEATITSGGSVADAQTAYRNGITASMNKLGVGSSDIATYLAANGTLTTANAMQKIGYEANIALFLNPEAWVTWRRTGFPVLTPESSTLDVPRRMLYPQTEYSYNKANTPPSTMYTPKIFWDN